MLKSYEAIFENGQVKWLAEQPEIKSARVIVIILEETELPSDSITGEAKTFSEVLADEKAEPPDTELRLEELGESEPQAQGIPRRRYDV